MSPSILDQGQQQAEQLAVKVTSPDGKQVDGEASLTTGGESWWFTVFGRFSFKRGTQTQKSGGVEFTKRFFGGWGG